MAGPDFPSIWIELVFSAIRRGDPSLCMLRPWIHVYNFWLFPAVLASSAPKMDDAGIQPVKLSSGVSFSGLKSTILFACALPVLSSRCPEKRTTSGPFRARPRWWIRPVIFTRRYIARIISAPYRSTDHTPSTPRKPGPHSTLFDAPTVFSRPDSALRRILTGGRFCLLAPRRPDRLTKVLAEQLR